MYINLTDLKSRLWITWTDQDISLNSLLDRSWDFIVSQWYDLEEKQRHKTARIYDWYTAVWLDCPIIKSIDEINGTVVTRVEWEDYEVKGQYNHILVIKSDKLPLTDDPSIQIKYTAWYPTWSIPKILSDAQYYIICWLKYSEISAQKLFWWSREVKSTTQWPRSITYTDKWSESYFSKAQEIFNTVFYPISMM